MTFLEFMNSDLIEAFQIIGIFPTICCLTFLVTIGVSILFLLFTIIKFIITFIFDYKEFKLYQELKGSDKE